MNQSQKPVNPPLSISSAVRETASRSYYPTSFNQEWLWCFDQLFQKNPSYNLALASRIHGPLNLKILESALDAVVQRHASLRTVFELRDGVPVQVVLNVLPIEVGFTDLSDLMEGQRDSVVRDLVEAEARQPFDLALGPLLRMRAICVG